MSTFGADNITNVAGTGSPNIVGGELCRARTNLNGTGTIAPRDDFNISSYVDNGVGDYTANVATAFPNANYSPTATGGDDSAGTNIGTYLSTHRTVAPTTSAWRFQTWYGWTAGALLDTNRCNVAIFGDRP